MIKRMLIMLIMVGIVLGGIFGFISFKGRMIKQFMSSQGVPVQTVSSITANYLEWLPKLEAVGSLQAVQGASMSAEVAGIVEKIYFNQGDNVKIGTPLLQLRAYDDIAKLESLKATAQLTRVTYNRDLAQFSVNAISKQVLDIDKANLDIAIANIAQQQALVDKKLIRAPFTGRLGIRLVDIGQYLAVGTAITTLQALDTVFVDFYLPQQALKSLAIGQQVTLNTDVYPAQTFTGGITVINPKVDINTRNVQVRATLNNLDHKLLPGMYATVNIATGLAQRYITLPRTTITFNAFGSTVYRIDNDGLDAAGKPKLIAKQSFVTTGDTRGDQIAILTGVKEGETIVTTGQIKLRNGSPVIVDNTIQPSNDATPQPKDQ
ncbi:efflux RND transporter periplasmic adaptor subunit [Methylobacter sp. S3L5C]|uniref:efflux RND transporter periplasmic adaptor subunit n=1 Tax=Methylobacter sp. S3L5C TaxID=2839024 RepID=UPI001FACC9AF|nr:efflux RND transporter periplasmic adaptor subunit [Methylobacter sp. S3L5C]UOA08696.1 efflux RND transporter periplasmic adaptor subunit [Methylobacter sp. S3L5C]